MREAVTDRAKPAVALLAALMVTLALPGAVAPQEPNCRRRTVLVNVVDRDGFPVQGFSAEHFRASFRGQPVRILSAQVESRPRRIVVLLDASGSMQSTPSKWEMARRMAGDLIALIPAENSVALVTFGDKVYETVGFSQKPKEALEKIISLESPKPTKGKIGGRTALWDALLAALAMFGSPQSGDLIYVISDGGANVGRSSLRDVERAFLDSGTRAFAFALVDFSAMRSPEETNGLSNMKELTELTGGNLICVTVEYYAPRKHSDGVALGVRALYQQMISFYRLEIELPQDIDKPREWKLELVPGMGFKPADFRVTYPRKLLPCRAKDAAK